jgi:hypothetical protein
MLKPYDQMNAQEKANLQTVVQGVVNQLVAFRTSCDRLAALTDVDAEDIEDFFKNEVPEDRPVNQDDIQEFLDFALD